MEFTSLQACAPAVLETWTGTATAYPRDRTLAELFDAQVVARPTALAAVHGTQSITYRQLCTAADRLATQLHAAGISRGDLVGVCGTRSINALVAFLGILKAGGAYVPLDDSLPPDRVRAMAEGVGLDVVVRTDSAARRVRGMRVSVDVGAGQVSADPPVTPSAPTDCAYVMFTSGSTGFPKPVAIPHRGIVRLATGDPDLSTPGPEDRILFSCGLSSDASTIEIWSALVNGSCLVLVDHEDLLSPPALEQVLVSAGVTIAYFTTSVFHLMARTRPEALSGLRFASAGGEAMDPDLTRAVLAACPATKVVNFYGPTENSVVSTAQVVREVPAEATHVPIGRPIANSFVLVLREDGTPAGVGEEGELLVGGDGLALGYLGDPELTADRFVRHPFEADERVYRTGDRVRCREDGLLEFVGRKDRQIKLRGHRIELSEVESRLAAHSDIDEAVVLVEDHSLVGYVTSSVELPLPEIRGWLKRWLPSQAVPARLVQLEQFPVSANGKIDHKRIASAAGRQDSAATTHEIAGLQDTLAEIWRITLATEPQPSDSFFDIGGDSVLASEAVIRTLAVLGLDADHNSHLVAELLRNPTLAGFTKAVAAVKDGQTSPDRASDLDEDAKLGFELPPMRGPAPQWSRPKNVLLTGATGFLGAFLLDRVLRTTEAVVHLPVRGRDTAHARLRVITNLRRYGLQVDDLSRLECFPADLAAPGLGLSEARIGQLADSVDLILHSGAQVNFLYPYSALRAANVDGTREILKLAAARRIPVHFLSTVATLAGFGTAGVRDVDEDLPLEHGDHLTLGYAESKWVAEKMVLEAGDAGLPVAIYRPYEITGEQRTGMCNVDTAICSLFKTVAETGVAPDIALPIDFIPVDYVSDAIMHIATTRQPGKRVYHLTNPQPAKFSDVLDRMRAAGCVVDTLPYAQWVSQLVRYVADNPRSPTAPFVTMCIDRSRGADMSVKEMYFEGTFPVLSRDNVEKDLADSGLRCPPVDHDLLDLYLAYMFDSGFIQRP